MKYKALFSMKNDNKNVVRYSTFFLFLHEKIALWIFPQRGASSEYNNACFHKGIRKILTLFSSRSNF